MVKLEHGANEQDRIETSESTYIQYVIRMDLSGTYNHYLERRNLHHDVDR